MGRLEQSPIANLRNLQQMFRLPPFSDVVEHDHHADQIAFTIVDRRRTIVDDIFAAIFGDEQSVVGKADNSALPDRFCNRTFNGIAPCPR